MERDPVIEKARAWIEQDPDDSARAELEALIAKGAIDELRERFRGPLEFGTAGLRGVVGAGESRMNRAVVIRTTAGLAAWLRATIPDFATRGVVLGRDARNGSAEFLDDAAAVLAGAGIPAHVFDRVAAPLGVVPTPLVSWAVRELGAAAGVMVTASHNPPEYNGYKVYAANSAQIVPPQDVAIAHAIDASPGARDVPRVEADAARARGLLHSIPRALVDLYFDTIVQRSRRSEGRDALSIVYTPMHGVGDAFAREAFARMGFRKVVTVPEQAAPDGRFPTVRFPNPEEPGALDLALDLAARERADLIVANDPDADRLAIAVPRDDAAGFVQLSGNEVGVLLGHYLLADDESPASDRLAVATIVSSPLLGRICAGLGVRYAETLTGFKWITNKALEIEAATGVAFVIGYEEALGYTVDPIVRDKDGIGAAVRFAELAASLKARGETVLGRLERIYREFGLVVSRQHNVTRKGAEGAALIRAEMSAMRAAVLEGGPRTIGGVAVVAVRDYLVGKRTSFGDGAEDPLDMPSSDVLAFELEGGSRVTMRPSGTEPKIKYYFDVVEPLRDAEPFAEGRARAIARLDAVERDFVALAAAASTR